MSLSVKHFAASDPNDCSCPCRPVYVAAVRPQSKHIVVLVDHGASVTDTQLQIARDSALVILNAIDEHDKVRRGEGTKILPRPRSHPARNNSDVASPDLHPVGGRVGSLLLAGPVLQEPAVSGHQRDQEEDEHLHLQHQGLGWSHAARGGLPEGLPAAAQHQQPLQAERKYG